MFRIQTKTLGILTIFCGLLFLPILYWHSFRLPAPTGAFAVGTRTLDIVDPQRPDEHDPSHHRELIAQIWYPALPSSSSTAGYMRVRELTASHLHGAFLRTNSHSDAPIAAGPFPVLLFGHKWGGRRTQNTSLFEDLASHGYVVVSVDHPYVAARMHLDDGRSLTVQDRYDNSPQAAQQIAAWNAMLDTWTLDNTLVLDRVIALFSSHVDATRIGAFGHSFGGAAALALCGRDPRVVAAVNLDGWTFAGLDYRTAEQKVLILYEAEVQQQLEKPPPSQPSESDRMDAADTAAVTASLHRFGGTRIVVAGTQHADFTDEPLLPRLHSPNYTGPIRPTRINDLLRQTILQFFDATLKGQPPTTPTAPEFHPEP